MRTLFKRKKGNRIKMAKTNGSTQRQQRQRIVVDISKLNVVPVRGVTQRRQGQLREQRMFFDNLVRSAYEEWIAEGMPKDQRDRPGRGIEVAASEVDNVKKLIRASAEALNIGVRFGDVKNLPGRKKRVEFTAQTRKEYKNRGSASEEEEDE
jgi:hypothetical protein